MVEGYASSPGLCADSQPLDSTHFNAMAGQTMGVDQSNTISHQTEKEMTSFDHTTVPQVYYNNESYD